MYMTFRWTPLFVLLVLLSACAGAIDESGEGDGAYAGHAELSDLEPAPAVPGDGKADVISATFDQNFIVSDAFFRDGAAMSAAQIQTLLEQTPYGGSSWLARERVGSERVADVVARTARAHDIHPMMILTRFQVEGTHISRSRHPGRHSADRALGCGCFDGQSCRGQYLGVGKQIQCAAETMSKRYDGSVDGTWAWRKGRTSRSLDPRSVTPVNHATAALYAYTPWVLVNRGGNWLVWNVLKKFLAHSRTTGLDVAGEPAAWVGSPCVQDTDCAFSHNESEGFCYDFVDAVGATKGFCSIVCEGYCPDRGGAATTFCIEADVGGVGICASKAEPANNHCAAVPGTEAQELARFVGASDAADGAAVVCAPPLF